jgi:hypothetical protein
VDVFQITAGGDGVLVTAKNTLLSTEPLPEPTVDSQPVAKKKHGDFRLAATADTRLWSVALLLMLSLLGSFVAGVAVRKNRDVRKVE